VVSSRENPDFSEGVISMSTQISSDRDKTLGIAPEFISEVEDELSRRLGQPVTMVLGDGIVAVRAEGELFAGESMVVMDAGQLLSRKRVADWADAFERKINRLARRADDVERLYAAIQKSPSPEKTGEIVLEHIGDYDDDFFEALGMVIAHDKGCLRLGRACNFGRSGNTCAWCAGAPAMARRPLCGENWPKARHGREILAADRG
jgi:hypothetical protein